MFDKLMFSKHILLWHSHIPNFVQKSVATRTDKENWNCFLISAVSLHHAYLCCIWDNVFPILQELLRSFLSWDPFDQSQRVTVGRHFQHLCTGTQRKEKLASCCRLDEVDVCRNKLSNICIPTVIVDIWRINLPLFFPEEVLKLRCYLNTQGIGIFLYIRYLPHAWGVHSRLSLLLLTEPWFAFTCGVGWILGFSIVSWFPVFVEGEKESSVFLNGDSSKDDQSLSSAGSWNLHPKCQSCFMGHSASDPCWLLMLALLVVLCISEVALYHLLWLSSGMAIECYSFLPRCVWSHKNVNILTVISFWWYYSNDCMSGYSSLHTKMPSPFLALRGCATHYTIKSGKVWDQPSDFRATIYLHLSFIWDRTVFFSAIWYDAVFWF